MYILFIKFKKEKKKIISTFRIETLFSHTNDYQILSSENEKKKCLVGSLG